MTEEIKRRLIEDEMRESYVDYAMSVITSRALPNVYDGLKPVHRRILYAMSKMGLLSNKATVKSARITGETMGRYHPHGNAAIYDALVRMAQDFSLRYTLIKGQGNFGNIDGDNAAAERYTEAKLTKLAEEMLQDLEKETVNFIPNYDGSTEEPIVLPAKLPNLLINGSSGIAVGMATNIPPHNLSEVCSALIAMIDNPEITLHELMNHVKGPDFPTGGYISGVNGILSAYKTGRGKIIMKAKTEIEEDKIVVKEIPYMVNKSNLIEEMVRLVHDKRIDSIADIRDESDKKGMRLVIKVKKNADPSITLNQLFTHTSLKSSFGANMLALHEGQPKILNLEQFLRCYLQHRKNVVTRRTQYDLRKAEERAHVLEGLKVALENIDPVIKLIKSTKTVEMARNSLMQQYSLSDIQANAILDMKLQKLTSLETEKIENEHKDLLIAIDGFRDILSSEQKIFNIIKQEVTEIKEKFGDERRTQITAEDDEILTEDLIEKDNVVVTVTHSGFIKQLPLDTYKTQHRGGKGIIAARASEEDAISDLFVTLNHNYLLFFSSKGKVYWLKAYQIPEASRYARGKAIVNLLRLEQGEKINAILPISKFDPSKFIMFATKKGLVKKTSLTEYSKPRKGGIIAINIRENDEVVDVKLTDGTKNMILASDTGSAVRFRETDSRPMGRNSTGVRGISLSSNEEVIGMVVEEENSTLLTVTENGFGKRTAIDDYRLINRGGKGVINIKTSERNGKVIGIKCVSDNDEVMLISSKGIITRVSCKEISKVGRNTQGVRIMRVVDDKVTTLAKVVKEE
jgi:DNA gyrase subunit A